MPITSRQRREKRRCGEEGEGGGKLANGAKARVGAVCLPAGRAILPLKARLVQKFTKFGLNRSKTRGLIAFGSLGDPVNLVKRGEAFGNFDQTVLVQRAHPLGNTVLADFLRGGIGEDHFTDF